MAIVKSVVDVNSGNSGWDRADVIDALETVFSNLGWHSGSARAGVPLRTMSPTGSYTSMGNTSWLEVGGPAVSEPRDWTYKHYRIRNISNTSYRVLEEFYTGWTNNNITNNTITLLYLHDFTTGDAIHWAPGETDESLNLNGLTLDTVYYVIVVNRQTIKLAASESDALAGIEVDLLGSTTGPNSSYAGNSSTVSFFRTPDTSAQDNATITVYQRDYLTFYIDDQSGGNMFLLGNTDNYDSNKLLTEANLGSSSYRSDPSYTGDTEITWSTQAWQQTEYNTDVEQIHQSGQYRTHQSRYRKYIYASDTHSAMKGEIVVLPSIKAYRDAYPHWNYTVPASGSRSELKLRVYRWPNGYNSSYTGRIAFIELISSDGYGWSDQEVFTIPGESVGGVATTNDINFGVRTRGSVTDGDGVAEIAVTNVGAGSSFYQKHDDGAFGILRVTNDSNKDYGTSFYTFSTDTDEITKLYINSGSGWDFLNKGGTSYGSSTTDGGNNYGYFTGVEGTDRQRTFNFIPRNDNSFTNVTIASSVSPTSYPLSIRVYRAQAPQDSNFAILQFTQNISGSIIPFATFTIHKGQNFGSNIWDLDHVYLGSLTTYTTSTRSVTFNYTIPGYGSYYDSPNEEPNNGYSKSRDASYGFLRDSDDNGLYGATVSTTYSSNIDTNNSDSGGSNVTYYRNSTYDGDVSSSADYYKPIKGIPICNSFIPCPYYLPDDFVILQFSTAPGLTEFRPGDTVTISASEVYEIVLAGYSTSQTGLDQIANNNSIGLALLARTT